MKHLALFSILISIFNIARAQELSIKINHQYQNQILMYDSNYLDHSGTVFLIERLQYYLSGFKLKFKDGSVKELNDEYILVSSNISNYKFFNTKIIENVDQIDSISFSLGVDEEANHSDPNSYPDGHALTLTNPSMHWGWLAGYRFIAFEGLCDNNNDKEAEKLMELHITGSDSYYTSVPMIKVTPKEFEDGFQIEFLFDLYQLLHNYKVEEIGVKHGPSSMHNQMLKNIEDGIVFGDEVIYVDTLSGQDSIEIIDSNNGALNISENQMNYNISIHNIGNYAPTIFYKFDSNKPLSMRVIDLNGRVLYFAENMTSEGNHFISKELSKGLYFVQFLIDDKKFTKQFTIN